MTETSIFCVPSLSLKLYNHKSLAVFISFIALVLWNHTFPTSLPEFNNRVRWHVMCFSLFPILRQYWIDVLTFTAMILTYARADAIGNSGVWWLLLDKICLNSVLFFSLFINTSLLPFFSLFTYLSFFLKFSPFFMGVKIY